VFATGVNEARADRAAGAARDQLAKLQAGIKDRGNIDPATLAQIGALSPEDQKVLVEQMLAIQNREDTQAYGTSEREAGQEFTTSERLSGEKFTGGQNDLDRGLTKRGQDIDVSQHEDTFGLQQDEFTERKRAAGVTEDISRGNLDVSRGNLDVSRDQLAETQREGLEAEDPGARVMEEYKRGAFGPVGSPDAEARMEAAFAKATDISKKFSPAESVTPGQKKMDEDFAPQVTEWKTSGAPNAVKALTQVQQALATLDESKDQTFGTTGVIGLLPEFAQTLINEKGLTARDAIYETVQQTLRQALGAQFTQQEGQALMARAFDPRLGEQENIRRAKLLMEQVAITAQNKMMMVDYWDANNGTLSGYKGGGDAGYGRLTDLLKQFNKQDGRPEDEGVGTGGAGGGGGLQVEEIEVP
jgi:hypothetical protein